MADDQTADRRNKGTVFERHAQTVLSSVVLLLLTWSGNKLNDLSDRLIRVETLQLASAGAASATDVRISRLEALVHTLEVEMARRPPAPRQPP